MKYILFSVIMNVTGNVAVTTEVSQTQMYFGNKENCVAAMARLIPNPTSTGDLSREMTLTHKASDTVGLVKMAHNVYCFQQ